jgi:hypothetical protein
MINENNSYDLQVPSDLQNILAVLKPQDAKELVRLKEELADKQIFRTETEMRVSVLNDAKHPTPASKYWQSVREMSAHFDALMALSFDIRKSDIQRLKLERQMNRALQQGDDLEIMEVQVHLDENLYNRACMEQVAHDRVREISTWSKIKAELNDGSFDDKEVNNHQLDSLKLRLENKAKAINENTSPAEVINILGVYQTIERIKQENQNGVQSI